MKKEFLRLMSVILCLTLVFSVCTATASAAKFSDNGIFQGVDCKNAAPKDNLLKLLYNTLNVLLDRLAQFVCLVYPNSIHMKNIKYYDGAADGFMPGRSEYKKQAGEGNFWSLGFASLSIVPPDIECGKYNLARDPMNKYAKGVYDDQRVRISVFDDNSGEGAVVFGAVDGMGITSADVRSIRKGILAYAASRDFKICSINIAATHSHSCIDVQGISTEFFYKFLFQGYNNILGISDKSGRLEHAEFFKRYFIARAIEATKAAIDDMESGRLFFSPVDAGHFISDKRGLISEEDMPPIASFRFIPDSGSEDTFLVSIPCHPTSFSADYGLISSDYIYYLEEYLKENANGANVVMVPGAIGQLSRKNINPDLTGMTEHDIMGAQSRQLGHEFGKLILAADYSKELDPLINITHKDIFIEPDNHVLALFVEANLVNNKLYGNGLGGIVLPTEMGYLEFGNAVALALFPAEFYPETFWGADIAGNPTWDGTVWPYPAFNTAVEGIDIYPVSLMNDQLGYVLTDNNYAFMGHIIGDDIADEVLSVGKHMGSHIAEEYFDMIAGFVK